MRKNKTAARIAFVILAALAVSLAGAQEARESLSLNVVLAYSPPNLDGYGASGFAPVDYHPVAGGAGLRDLGTTWGGGAALATLTYSRTIPAFVGDGPFFSGNNLEMAGRVELSPVTLEAFGYLTLTPAAFLKFQAGASIGTGWSLGFIGLALCPDASIDPIEEIPFGGAVLKTWVSGTFQFDLAAILPGEWNHLVLQATARFEYRNNTAAEPDRAWIWQADEGMNFDSWRLLGTYVLGYQMPRKLNFAGIMLETEANLGEVRTYSTMATAGWGSDFVTLVLSPLANLAFDDRNSLTFIVQIKSTQDWTDATTRALALQDRDYEGRLWKLERIAFSYTRKLK